MTDPLPVSEIRIGSPDAILPPDPKRAVAIVAKRRYRPNIVVAARCDRLQSVTPRGHDDIGPVTALCHDRDGSFWIGGENGVWRTNSDFTDWQWIGHAEGLLLPSGDLIYQSRSDERG